MNIQIGKTYRTASGHKAVVLSKEPDGDFNVEVFIKLTASQYRITPKDSVVMLYSSDGRCYGKPHYNIVQEN